MCIYVCRYYIGTEFIPVQCCPTVDSHQIPCCSRNKKFLLEGNIWFRNSDKNKKYIYIIRAVQQINFRIYTKDFFRLYIYIYITEDVRNKSVDTRTIIKFNIFFFFFFSKISETGQFCFRS